MNEELTREVLEAMAVCKGEGCSLCEAQEVCMGNRLKQFSILAAALLEERAKPKVWDGSPGNAEIADVVFRKDARNTATIWSKHYTRELPKSRTRQIAEKEGHWLAGKYGWSVAEEVIVTNRIESALTKYAEELDLKENTDD